MKIKPYEAEKLLGAPPASLRAFVIYGPDNGGVRLSAEKVVKTLLAQRGNDDPFNLRSLNAKQCADDSGVLTQEASNLSLGGGGIVVRVRGGGDNCTQALAHFLAAEKADGVIVIDSGNLTPRSTLRKLAEKEKAVASIACYADSPEKVFALVQQRIKAAGKIIERDGLVAFTQRLGDDRAITENEIEKLLLYMGDEKKISLDDVLAATGDRASMGLDELADCVGLGEVKNAMRQFDKLTSSGNDRVLIVNNISRHFQKLRLVLSAEGSASQNLLKLTPPLHFTRKDRFLRQCQIWTRAQTARALDTLWHTNLSLRSNATGGGAAAAHTLMSIALRAQKLKASRR